MGVTATDNSIQQQPIQQLINTNTTSNAPSNPGASALGPQAFLQLLTTELENQDPTSAANQDPTQQVTQLAQFTQVQSLSTLSSQFSGFQSTFSVLQTAGLIGRQVTVVNTDPNSGKQTDITGTVNAIDVTNGAPTFTMTGSNGNVIADQSGNAIAFSPAQIVGIGNQSPTTGSGN